MAEMEIKKGLVLDVLDTNAPALSSTNDLPVVETKPDASNDAPAEAPKEEPEQPSESATEATDEQDGQPAKKPSGVGKALAELRQQKREAEERAKQANDEKLRLLALLEERKPAPKEEDEPQKPIRTAFETTDAFDAALSTYVDEKASWVAKKEVLAIQSAEKAKAEETAIAEGQRQARDAYQTRVEKTKEKYADFAEVAESPNVTVSIPMAHAIVNSEHGPEIQYYLGKNPAEAQRISQLAPPVQLIELGEIVARIKVPAKPVITNAPKPINPITPGDTTTRKSPEDESMDEYAARRKKELARH